MSFSAGVFSINSTGQPVVTGTVISSTVFNALTADLATGLSTCVLKDGTQTITAAIPMAGFKFTGLGAGTAAGNSVRWEQVVIVGSQLTNSISGDVALNNTANYFDGPSVAQGSTGTWFASGTVVVTDTAGAATIAAKLWDGTTVIASTVSSAISGANVPTALSLSGYLATPAGNLRISVKDGTSTSGSILSNSSGNSKDSTISVYRIG